MCARPAWYWHVERSRKTRGVGGDSRLHEMDVVAVDMRAVGREGGKGFAREKRGGRFGRPDKRRHADGGAEEAESEYVAEHARTYGERENVHMLVRTVAKCGAERVAWRAATVERLFEAERGSAHTGRNGHEGHLPSRRKEERRQG